MSTVTDFLIPDMAFAERLTQLRKERGLTLQALGCVYWTQLQRYETGAAQPTRDVLKRLAIALSASTDWLLFEEGSAARRCAQASVRSAPAVR